MRTYSQWVGNCPACGVTRFSSTTCGCPNCRGALWFQFERYGFDANDEHRSLVCGNGCGWRARALWCPECNAKIAGRFLGYVSGGGSSHEVSGCATVALIGVALLVGLALLVVILQLGAPRTTPPRPLKTAPKVEDAKPPSSSPAPTPKAKAAH